MYKNIINCNTNPYMASNDKKHNFQVLFAINGYKRQQKS